MKANLSNRKFLLLWIEGEDAVRKIIFFDRLFHDAKQKGDYEYIYALQSDIDIVLDLKEGEKIPFQFNRDDETTKGFIKRIN